MPYYEVLCLASGKLARAEVTDLLRKACNTWMRNGATVTRVKPLGADGTGARKLAYRIRMNQVSYDTGYYVNICAFSSPDALAEVRRILKIDERILRTMALRRSIADALEPLPDYEDMPPTLLESDPNDPDYALQKFMEEYEREFPEGISYSEPEVPRTERGNVGERAPNDKQGQTLDNAVERLKASGLSSNTKKEVGLAWLADPKITDLSRKGKKP